MDNLTGALQENVLTLLCFDDEAIKILRGVVTPQDFESVYYRDIARFAISFYDNFGKAIKEHLPDELEHVLSGSDKKKAEVVDMILRDLFLAKDTINRTYVMGQLERFVHQQSMKRAVLDAADALHDGDLDLAEKRLESGLERRLTIFDPGIQAWESSKMLSFYDYVDLPSIPMGVHHLDTLNIGPRKRETTLLIAPPKKGKTWWMISCGKNAMLRSRYKVLHITLEMAEPLIALRYIQSLFSVGKSEARILLPRMLKDESGALSDVTWSEVTRVALRDPASRKYVGRKLKSLEGRLPLVIKSFPTGSLTVSALKSYLHMLEARTKFVPDMILLDYPDLMSNEHQDPRVGIGEIHKKLRGIAVEGNLAMVLASQGNRTSSSARLITDDMVAEDYSKIATADTVLSYNQTVQEKRKGLARMFVSNARGEADKFAVLMTQAYSIGQFCLESAVMSDDYWDRILKGSGGSE